MEKNQLTNIPHAESVNLASLVEYQSGIGLTLHKADARIAAPIC